MSKALFVAVLLLGIAGSFAETSYTPEQIHSAFAGGNGLSIVWFTMNETSSSVVRYGLDDAHLTQTATGSSVNYGMPGFHHTVVIQGLKPFTKYFYQCGDATHGFSNTYSVVTSLPAGDASPFTVAILGDNGLINGANATNGIVHSLEQNNFIWHLGDISYADDTLESYYESTWNEYMNRLEPIAANKAYMTMPGNHETTCSEALPFACAEAHRNFTAYLHRFRMPFAESGAVNNMWHSFDYGLVHFVSISTETDFPGAPEGPGTYLNAGPFGDQMKWLEQDLQKAVANRQQVPWIIVGGHRPVYSGKSVTDALVQWLEPLFLQYDVDMYFCGHVHWYERMYPVAQGQITQKDYNNPTVPVYIVNGAGGNVEGHEGTDKNHFPAYQALWNNEDFGFGQLSIQSPNQLQWTFYRGADLTVLDHITLVKNVHANKVKL